MRILLTGCSSGIGRRLTTDLLAAGHAVWGVARHAPAEPPGGEFQFRALDVSDWPAVEALAEEIGAQWDRLNAVITCAGTQGPIGPAAQADPLAWSRAVRQNIDGTFFPLRASFDLLGKSEVRPKVLCFSGGGATQARPRFSAYATAKCGIVRLVETLAVEWREVPVDVNAVAPGAFPTSMTEAVAAAGSEAAGAAEHAAALQRLAAGGDSWEKLSALVAFLLSPAADGLSGRLLSAQWDDLAALAQEIPAVMAGDRFTLRRQVPPR